MKRGDKVMEVLGGRLTVRVPEGTRAEPRPYSMMAAPEPVARETRIILEGGQERLLLLAEESFAFAGDDFEKDVQEWVAKWKGRYRVEALHRPGQALKMVAVTPLTGPDHSRSDDAAFLEGILVESEDRTIQSLDVYVNAAAEKDLDGCRALAHRILLSAAPGKRKLDLTPGERRFFAYSKDVEISVIVDQNMVATTQVGPDFLVHRLKAIGSLGADAGSIGLYVGSHPNFTPGRKKEPGSMFGRSINWYSFREGEGLQTLCAVPIPGERGLNAHVWIQAPDETRLTVMKKVAETLKLVESRSVPSVGPIEK